MFPTLFQNWIEVTCRLVFVIFVAFTYESKRQNYQYRNIARLIIFCISLCMLHFSVKAQLSFGLFFSTRPHSIQFRRCIIQDGAVETGLFLMDVMRNSPLF